MRKRSDESHGLPLLKCKTSFNSHWQEVVVNDRYCLCLITDNSEATSGPTGTEAPPLSTVEDPEQNETTTRNIHITDTDYYMWTYHIWEITILTYCCHLLRVGVRRRFQWPLRSRILLEEFINATDLCACFWDMYAMGWSCGVFPWYASRYFMNCWWLVILGKMAVHPNRHLEAWLRKRITIKEATIFFLIDVAGGKISYSVASMIWYLPFHDHHHAVSICKPALKVAPYTGAFLECLVHFISRLNGMCADQWPILGFPPYRAGLNLLMVGLCLHHTGTFINPLVATTLMFKCPGQIPFIFIFVYWGGAVAGSLFALIVYLKVLRPRFVRYFHRARIS